MSLTSDRPKTSRLLEAAAANERGARVIARTLFREMQRSGFTRHQILAVADELLGCLCGPSGSRQTEEAASGGPRPDELEQGRAVASGIPGRLEVGCP